MATGWSVDGDRSQPTCLTAQKEAVADWCKQIRREKGMRSLYDQLTWKGSETTRDRFFVRADLVGKRVS
jgi:hypothetical protein